jgi:serine protease Do
MKKLGTLLVCIIVFSRVSMVSADAPVHITSFADIIEPLMPSVVNVYTVKYNKQSNSTGGSVPGMLPIDKFNNFFEQFNVPFAFDETYDSPPSALALGSGFIVDEEGYVITNDHVVTGSDEIYIKLSDNTELPAKIIGTDPKTDIALLKINTKNKLIVAEFSNSSDVRVGDVVIAIGNPLGFGGTVTTGIVSSKGRDLGLNRDELVDDFLQTDAAINTGNSGGPLYDINGKVIGINTSVPDINGGTNIGIGFAIPSNTVLDIMKQLKEKGKVSRGRLDIAIQEITEELAEALSLTNSFGVLVVNVRAGGAGAKSGLKQRDIITEFDGQTIMNSRKLQLFVADSQIGEKVKLTVIRDNKTLTLVAKIVEYEPPKDLPLIDKENLLYKSDVIFSNLSQNIKEKFGYSEDSNGVVIVGFDGEEAPSDLKIGDLVIAIDQQQIQDIEQFNNVYKKLLSTKKNNVVLLVKRGDYTMFVALPLK